ncbi:hypothetical protein FOXYSP1_17222 [Fusarium oxysporum f. sp. phaseoli]
MPMKVIQKLLHHLIVRKITKVSPATTVPFAQCNVRHCSKTKEKKRLHQSERRLSRRVPKFTKRAEQSMSEGSWVACLLTRPKKCGSSLKVKNCSTFPPTWKRVPRQ